MTPAKDRPRRLTIRVLARDIGLGVPDSEVGCPIARALHRHAGFGDAWVTACSIEGAGSSAELPLDVQDFIEDFDRGGAVQPFSFEIEVPW